MWNKLFNKGKEKCALCELILELWYAAYKVKRVKSKITYDIL